MQSIKKTTFFSDKIGSYWVFFSEKWQDLKTHKLPNYQTFEYAYIPCVYFTLKLYKHSFL